MATRCPPPVTPPHVSLSPRGDPVVWPRLVDTSKLGVAAARVGWPATWDLPSRPATLIGMRKHSSLVGIALLAGLGLAATTIPAAATPPSGGIAWHACAGANLDPRQQCGTVTVPLDYAHPGGPAIELAVSRVPSTDPARRRGTLVLVPGGPGNAG